MSEPSIPNGRSLLAQGREAEVFLQSDGTVLKLWRDPASEWRLECEAAALTALAEAGVPAPLFVTRMVVDGRPGLVMRRLDGPDLLTRLGRQPLTFLRAGKTLGIAHSAMHDVVAPPQLPLLNDALRERILHAPPLPDDLRSAVLALLDRLPEGDRLCHGDFHLGNVMGTWKTPVIIDWGDASRGDPVADVARTDLMQRLGDLPPGSPSVIRLLAPIGRDALAASYLYTYRRRHKVDRRLLKEWRLVRAAARLIEPIPSEHPKLIRYLRKRLNNEA